MHDSLGHDLSLIALRAGALQVDPRLDPVLEPAVFAALSAGDPAEEVSGVLPPREVTALPPSSPPTPPSSDCRHYRSDRDPFTASPVYRLCLTDGVLVVKDVLTLEEPPR